MERERKIVWVGALIGALTLALAGQNLVGLQKRSAQSSANGSGVTGVWQVSTPPGTAVLMLNPDGSGEFNGEEIHWTFEQNILTIAEPTSTTMYNAALAGDSLTLSGANLRAPITFKRLGSGGTPQTTSGESDSNSGGGLAAVSGGGGSPAVVGTWQVQNTSGTFTLVLDANGSGKFNNDKIRWQFNQGVLTLSWENGTTYMYNTSLAGDTLSVSGGNLSQPILFHRLGPGGGTGGLAAAAGATSKSPTKDFETSGPVGNWETQGSNGPVSMVLNAGGTGNMAGENIHWKFNQEVLMITRGGGDTHMYNAKLAADSITLTSAVLKQPSVFHRVGQSSSMTGSANGSAGSGGAGKAGAPQATGKLRVQTGWFISSLSPVAPELLAEGQFAGVSARAS